jgi:tetratricopeptide (TPR) repeat protein
MWNRKGLADALRHLHKIDEAKHHYRWVIDNASAADLTARILWLIGWCYYGCGEVEPAIRCVTEALSFDPGAVSSQFDLALLLAASKRFSLSLSEYQRWVELSQSKVKPLSRRGVLHVAAVDLQRARQADPKIRRAPEMKQALDLLQAKLESARVEAQRATDFVRRPESSLAGSVASTSKGNSSPKAFSH